MTVHPAGCFSATHRSDQQSAREGRTERNWSRLKKQLRPGGDSAVWPPDYLPRYIANSAKTSITSL
jgi:hypothetical protein